MKVLAAHVVAAWKPSPSLACEQQGAGSAENEAVPRLSIGLPVYNGGNLLAEALEALLGQSYEDFELIISDNASTDGTADSAVAMRSKIPGSATSVSRATSARTRTTISSIKQARGELFKHASHDDLYARDLLNSALPRWTSTRRSVLAHCWEA